MPLGPRTKTAVFLLAILFVGAFLRFHGVTGRSLEYDDTQSVMFAARSTPDVLRAVRELDPHPPLFYLQLHYWMRAGGSDAWLRINSGVWGLLGILALYAAVRYVFRNNALALAAALLLAVNPMAVRCALQVRMYPMVMTLATLAWLGTHGMLATPRLWKALLFGLLAMAAALAATWTHGTGVLIYPALAVYALVYTLVRRGGWPRLLLAGALLGLSALGAIPWLRAAQDISVGHTQVPNVKHILETLAMLFAGFQPAFAVWALWGAFLVLLCVCGVLMRRRRSAAPALAAGLIVTPLLLFLVISHEVRAIWLARPVASIPTPALCAGVALVLVPAQRGSGATRPRWRFRAGLCGLLLVAASQAWLAERQKPHLPDYGYGQLTAWLKEHAQPNDTIVPSRRLVWGVIRYWAGPDHHLPIGKGRLDVEGGPTIIAWIPTRNIEAGKTYWLIYRPWMKWHDLAGFAPLVKNKTLRTGKEHTFGKLAVLRATLPKK